jgi:hypothetical protein
MSSDPIRLEPSQLRELAALIAEDLRGASSSAEDARPLVDAATVAKALGLSRAAVYARANELGAVRLGDGSRARLRFDVERAREALRSSPRVPARDVSPPPPPPRRRRPRREHILKARPRSKA